MGFGRQAAFRSQSSHPPDFGMSLVALPFMSGVLRVWVVFRVGRTIPLMGPQHNLQQNLSSLCPDEKTGGSWGRSTRRIVQNSLQGEEPTEKLPSPV